MSEPAPPEETKMDIHKPRPIRNWREFAKEYAIIVLGVVTALAAEQAVEWLHWQNEVRAARTALTAEFTINDSFFTRRLDYAPCVDRQIAEAQAIIADLQARKPPRRFTTFHANVGSARSDSEWQSERAAQALTHFPRQELALMGRYYAMLPDMEDWLRKEIAAGHELSILQDPPAGLDLATLMRLKVNLATVQYTERLIVLNAKRQLRLSRQLGHTIPAPEPERTRAFCTLSDQGWTQYIEAHEPRDTP